jgi:exo-beta-1,3-glucanase (GH17 family)
MTKRAAAVLIMSVLLIVPAWWWPNRVTAEPFPAGRLDAVSFAPYRPGETPVAQRFPTSAQVGQDIALLAPHVRAIRTYTARGGPADVPALAGAHGLKVWQGIWLGDNPVDNAREIEAGIALANRYPGVIDRVIVGSEVLLRGDLTPADLIADIDRVRAAVRQPVAYAEVWESWLKYPQVAAHVDQLLVHLLPYWENQPLGIDRAVPAELGYLRRIQARFPGKTVVVGETGWPSLGRWRKDAAPGRVNEARYLRDFTAAAARAGIETNVIEAFDQDWKAGQEGTVGAAWGLWTADRQPKFPPGVPVRDDPAWPWHAAASVLLGALLLAAGRRFSPRDVALAMALAAALVWAWAGIAPWAIGVDRLTAATVNLAGQAAMAWLLVSNAPPSAPRPLSRDAGVGFGLLAVIAWAFLLTALYLQIMLLTDPRYRDFPTPAFAVPVVAAAFGLRGRAAAWPEAVIAAALAATAIAGAIQEGVANRQSLFWCAAALLLAAPPLAAQAVARAAPWRVMTRA